MDFFFDIPVYRLTRKKYEADQAAHIQNEIENESQDYYVKKMFADNPTQEQQMRDHLRKSYGGAWQFNEIIGYIRLHFYGDQIRGEWWRVNAKRVVRSRTKHFEYYGHKVVHEESIPKGSTSSQIYGLILSYLKRAQEDKYLKRFYVDTSVFERIGPHVDWNAAFQALDFFRPNKRMETK